MRLFLLCQYHIGERIVQYLGRIGRGAQECIAVDFFDENTPMLRSSFNKRQRGYKKMG